MFPDKNFIIGGLKFLSEYIKAGGAKVLRNGAVIDDAYEIVREIGSGGTGIVYLAYHRRLQKYVVVKKIKEDFVGMLNTRAEVDILKHLHHTYLPQVYDFLQLGNEVYTVMEYIQGYDLQQYQKNGYRFTEEQLVLWLTQLCEVLEYMHEQHPSVLHSDIKPSNIMITQDGNVCLIDFNISLEEDDVEGIKGVSPWFAAPEQYQKAYLYQIGQDYRQIKLDARMDIYSLGATFYSLMTNSLPSPDPAKLIPLSYYNLPYSNGLINIVSKAMQHDIKKRFQTMSAMGKSMRHVGKSDTRYQALRAQSIALDVGYGLLLLIGILMTIYGGTKIRRENFQEDYREVVLAAEQMDDNTVIRAGNDLLNNTAYQSYLEAGEERAEILYAIGNSYYNKENYSGACTYYEYAIQEDEENFIYYKDAAIATAKTGDAVKANDYLSEAKSYGIDTANLSLIEASIAAEEKDWNSVIQAANQVVQTSMDQDVRADAELLLAQAYGKLGDKQGEIKALSDAAELTESYPTIRRLGEAYLELAQETENEKQVLLDHAAKCYQRLEEGVVLSYQDQMNMAIVFQLQGKYTESLLKLQKLTELEEADYHLYVYLTYVEYLCQEEKDEASRNYFQLKSYYSNAEYQYQQAGSPQDAQMDQIEEIMKQVNNTIASKEPGEENEDEG